VKKRVRMTMTMMELVRLVLRPKRMLQLIRIRMRMNCRKRKRISMLSSGCSFFQPLFLFHFCFMSSWISLLLSILLYIFCTNFLHCNVFRMPRILIVCCERQLLWRRDNHKQNVRWTTPASCNSLGETFINSIKCIVLDREAAERYIETRIEDCFCCDEASSKQKPGPFTFKTIEKFKKKLSFLFFSL